MKNIFNFLSQKQSIVIPLLMEMTEVIIVTSDLMIDCVENYDHSTSSTIFKKIKEQEEIGDDTSTKIFNELNSAFVTNFDREDIHQLTELMDDVIDCMNSCAKRIVLYNPKHMPDSSIKLAKYIKDGANTIKKAIMLLEDLKKNSTQLRGYCHQLHSIENKADDVYESFVIDLFNNEKDAIEVIKLKEIVAELEKATDAADYIGKLLKTMIVKYA